MTDKLIRDGRVAVIYSPNFGAGWSSWQDDENADFFLHDPALCEAVLAKDFDAARRICAERFPYGEPYFGGLEDCEVAWLPEGEPFYIHEYDGSEHIVTSFRVA